MITAPGSGCGKTTITCAIIYGLKKYGKKLAALKCGPDYIDPLFHRRVLGVETGNLDLFMANSNVLKDNLTYISSKNDITIIEGAMGYFDGIGMTEAASAYDIARKTKTPVILIIDGKGMARSILAVLDGFLANDLDNNIKGVIVNNTSEKIWEFAKSEFNKRGIAPIGWLPALKAQKFDSRHLGLITPDEVEDFDKIISDIYTEIEDKIDWNGLIRLAEEADGIKNEIKVDIDENSAYVKANITYNITHNIPHIIEPDITIAIARDQAFCFYYSENIRMLKDYGCRIKYFSPIKDQELPEDADGLILWGGYPECFARELTENKGMLADINRKITGGMPTIAECGGFLYLQKSLENHPMVGIFDQCCTKEDRLKNFGYINMTLNNKKRLFGKDKMTIKAHEFHYCHMPDEGDCFDIRKASGIGHWSGCVTSDTYYAGFPHIYFPGNVEFLEAFLSVIVSRKGCCFTGANKETKV